jgi:hypothetical protein
MISKIFLLLILKFVPDSIVTLRSVKGESGTIGLHHSINQDNNINVRLLKKVHFFFFALRLFYLVLENGPIPRIDAHVQSRSAESGSRTIVHCATQ